MYNAYLVPMLGDDATTGAPDPSTTTDYASWVASVKAFGGAATTLPNLSTTLAARYPATVWVPQVNAGVWPQPDAYSSDGQYGYYTAPPLVREWVAVHPLYTPTAGEIAQGAAQLTPEWFKTAMAALGATGKIALGLGLGYLAVKLYFSKR